MRKISRRQFGAMTAGLYSSVLIAPSLRAQTGKLNIAGVGIGGMGRNYLSNVSSENIVALCDVDQHLAAKTYKQYPGATHYRDYRVMLAKEKGIDAVVIGTPDHTHAGIAMLAIQLGKHVYCAKPLTRTVHEARRLTEAAAAAGVATQMSVQGDATEGHRLLCEWIWGGAIGAVSEVHIWSNRPIWPQGLTRPRETPPVPPHLDWDLWLGPAPERPYHPAYHPFKFRGWWDFGTGALGDMGCHGLNPIFKALKLGHPSTVRADSTELFPETAPKASTVYYEFPARGELPPVSLTWYDGGREPKKPAGLENTRPGSNYGGILFIGSDGMLACDGVGGSPRLVPEEKMKAFERPAKTLPRSIGHYKEWLAACKGGPPAGCHFGVGGPLTEVVLLGNVAIRTREKLVWNPVRLECIGSPAATRLLQESYRDGWTIDGLGG